jgi:hypothetical protein
VFERARDAPRRCTSIDLPRGGGVLLLDGPLHGRVSLAHARSSLALRPSRRLRESRMLKRVCGDRAVIIMLKKRSTQAWATASSRRCLLPLHRFRPRGACSKRSRPQADMVHLMGGARQRRAGGGLAVHEGEHHIPGGVQCGLLAPCLCCERRMILSAEARIPLLEGRV